MMLDVTADENHVDGEHHSAAQHYGISAIQSSQPLGRHGEEIKANQRGESASPNPQVNFAAGEQRQEKRNNYDARARDEGSLGWRGVFQAGGLKNVSGE